MSACYRDLRVKLTWPHEDSGVCLEVNLRQLRVLIESLTIVLQEVVGEETGVDVFAQELSDLQHQFVLHSLKA